MKRIALGVVVAMTVATLACITISGCASSAARKTPPPLAREADAARVAGCEFLGTVLGSARASAGRRSSLRERFPEAFYQIAFEAGSQGATHYVVDRAETSNPWSPMCGLLCGKMLEISGKAYRCPPEKSTSRQPWTDPILHANDSPPGRHLSAWMNRIH